MGLSFRFPFYNSQYTPLEMSTSIYLGTYTYILVYFAILIQNILEKKPVHTVKKKKRKEKKHTDL
jgi:hypothetical protein